MFEEESPNGMSEVADSDTAAAAMAADVSGAVDAPQNNLAVQDAAIPTPASADVAAIHAAETPEPIAQVDAIPVVSESSHLESTEPAIEITPDELSTSTQDININIGGGDANDVSSDGKNDVDIESDDFIKEKVAKAKVAKKKASATAARARATRKAKEKLPDLGDGSGYEPPDPVIPNPYSTEVVEPVDDALWYAVHCYSGYENKVKHSLEQRIETMGMAGRILEIVVPTEEEIEVRDGKRKTVERRVFPGYVIVRMRMSEDSWFVVRNTPGVTRFIGMGNRPQPLSPQEVNQILKRMEAEAPKIRVSFKTGQKVRITDGPFADLMGLVDRIDTEHAKVVVLVNFFGRDTPVELDFLQVEKM